MTMTKLIAFALALGLSAAAYAQSAGPASIQIVAPWARSTPNGAKNGAAYMTIRNLGTTDDRLVAVATSAADKAEMHKTENDNGVMKMVPVAAVPVKAGGQAVFRPAGYHIMLVGLKNPLIEGESIPLTLVFEKAGKIDVTVRVQKIGAAEQKMEHMDHGGAPGTSGPGTSGSGMGNMKMN